MKEESGIDYCTHAKHENDARTHSEEHYNCCDCGGNDCGCAYCWSCNACEYCKNN